MCDKNLLHYFFIFVPETMPIDNFLTTTFMTPVSQRPEDNTRIIVQIPRAEYHEWIQMEEMRYGVKFYNRTKSTKQRREKNEQYLASGYIAPPRSMEVPPAKKQKGVPPSVFSEVKYFIILAMSFLLMFVCWNNLFM